MKKNVTFRTTNNSEITQAKIAHACGWGTSIRGHSGHVVSVKETRTGATIKMIPDDALPEDAR